MATDREVMVRVRNLLSDPDRWNQSGSYAADSRGYDTGVLTNEACKWCLGGAVFKVTNKEPVSTINDLSQVLSVFSVINDTLNPLSALKDNRPYVAFTTYNDEVSHESIMALIDKVIENMSKGGENELEELALD